MNFGDFYREWADKICISSSPNVVKSLYFLDEIDVSGIDEASDFLTMHEPEWSRVLTGTLEARAALAARLDAQSIAKFRLINDRHTVNLARAEFLDDYHVTIDERTLFLIYNKIPPMRVCSALTAAKTATFALAIKRLPVSLVIEKPMMLNAIATIFQIELHNTMRGYIYFERQNNDERAHFRVTETGDEEFAPDYYEPTENCQLVLPSSAERGRVELF